MIPFDIINPVEKAGDVVEKVSNGDAKEVSKFFEQLCLWGLDAAQSILGAIIIYIVGRYIINLIKRLMNAMMERRKMDPTIRSFLSSFINILLTILLLITVVSTLGVNTTSFAALLASAGVAVGMALSGNLQNLAGGIVILLFKPYKVGHYISAQGIEGVVKEIQIFHTIVTTVDNKEVYVPNGALSSGTVVNYSANPLRRVDLTFSVEYGIDVNMVRNVLLGVASRDDRILREPTPFVALAELSDSSIDFVVRLWVDAANYWDVFFDMKENVYAEFNKQGISFPFPQLTVHQG
ncbi:MAG: mechanosensitive ion channel [Bacteroidaceae bacterium]|nr:mechanosensitive ion channel [Bacteroidaceae bacterium]